MNASAVYCTYCSWGKDPAPGLLPAKARYTSGRIDSVRRLASERKVGLRILSGEFCLLHPEEPVPFYDHLLKVDEVAALSAKIASQLREQRIHKLVYFTKPAEDNPSIRPYLATIQRACDRAGVTLEVRHLDVGENMPDFRRIMAEAEQRKAKMLTDQTAGEQSFLELIDPELCTYQR